MTELASCKILRSDLSAAESNLVQAAEAVRLNAYAPYSSFAVGAAVRAMNGQIFCGANMENASYGLTICAEVSALAATVAATGSPALEALAIVGGPQHPPDATFASKHQAPEPVPPCGRCRQLIEEATRARRDGKDVAVYFTAPESPFVIQTTASALLPGAFDASYLSQSDG